MRPVACIALLLGLAWTEAWADRIIPLQQSRTASAYSLAVFGVPESDSQLLQAADFGPFDVTAAAEVRTGGGGPIYLASATTRQVSGTIDDSLHAAGSARSEIINFDAERAIADARSLYYFRFRIDSAEPYHLVVRLDVRGGRGGDLVVANMILIGDTSGVAAQLESRCDSDGACDGVRELRHDGVLLPGVYGLRAQALAAGESFRGAGGREFAASFAVDIWLDPPVTGVEPVAWGAIKALYRGGVLTSPRTLE